MEVPQLDGHESGVNPSPPLVHASINARTTCSAGGLVIAAIWRGIDSKGQD